MTEQRHISIRGRFAFLVAISLLIAVFLTLLWKENTTSNQSAPRSRSATPVISPITIKPIENSLYSLEELHYFQEIAFNSEHANLTPRIRKWAKDIVVRIEGGTTGEDLRAIEQTLREINTLQGAVTASAGYFDANLIIRFAPESTFKKWHGKYPPTNLGYFWVRWVDEEIYNANILIDTKNTTQDDRVGLIKEEMTQIMGLMNTSSRYKDSIFNDDSNYYQPHLSSLDKKLVEMLYRPEIAPSMRPAEALFKLSQITNDEQK